MEIFRMKTELYKKFLSSDVLLRTSGKISTSIIGGSLLEVVFRCSSILSHGFA